jgi:DNA-directed RNA polymerase specialized sigma24 family protein
MGNYGCVVGIHGGGRDQAFEAAFAELFPYAYNVGWRFFHDSELASDVAQETLTRAYLHWPKVSRHDKPKAWVIVTAVNVAQEFGRKRRPFIGVLAPDAAWDKDPFVHPKLLSALSRLSRRQRQVFTYRFAFDMSVEETAAELEITASQVKDATHEATTKLRKLLSVAPKPRTT